MKWCLKFISSQSALLSEKPTHGEEWLAPYVGWNKKHTAAFILGPSMNVTGNKVRQCRWRKLRKRRESSHSVAVIKTWWGIWHSKGSRWWVSSCSRKGWGWTDVTVSGITYIPLVTVTCSLELPEKPALEMGLPPSPTSNLDMFMPSVLPPQAPLPTSTPILDQANPQLCSREKGKD